MESSGLEGDAASCPGRPSRKEQMRLYSLLTTNRLGSRHFALGVETLLAYTLCMLVLRAVAQL